MMKKPDRSANAETLFSALGIARVYRCLQDRGYGKPQQEEAPLSLWTDDAASAKELLSYIRLVTDKNSPDYIPPKDRIVVSDLDGTLFCETDPTYYDFRLFRHRITEDPDYKDRATDYELSLVESLDNFIGTGLMPPGFEVAIGHAIANAFSGMTVAEFERYISDFADLPARGYDGMTQGEAFYKPMLQALQLLQKNGFSIFICSGSDRQVVRALVGGGLEVPPRQVLGTEEQIVARDQGSTDGTEYFYTENDELVLGGRIQDKNLKMNKVSVIAQEIGQQPVLCFGNSSGDFSMANYVTDDNRYITRVFMLCCDDLERENGNLKKAAEMEETCKKNGWVPVSMKNDWKTIYGEGVTRRTV